MDTVGEGGNEGTPPFPSGQQWALGITHVAGRAGRIAREKSQIGGRYIITRSPLIRTKWSPVIGIAENTEQRHHAGLAAGHASYNTTP